LETTYFKQLLFMAGNRPPSYERREVLSSFAARRATSSADPEALDFANAMM
jgi:hypothetical protein